jgi:hypothetical protein
MKQLYHYCAMRKIDDGQQQYVSGTFATEHAFESQEEYVEVFSQLGQKLTPPCAFEQLTVLSLTMIGERP